MARPGQDNVPKDEIPWFLKYGARILGIVGAFCKYLYMIFEIDNVGVNLVLHYHITYIEDLIISFLGF